MDVRIVDARKIHSDRPLAHVVATWGDSFVVAHGEAIHPARLPGFVALRGGDVVGHATYRVDGDSCELTSIDATPRHAGIGSALLDAVIERARANGCRLVWLTTTNDNLDAIRFYQRRGFRFRALRPQAVDAARRTVKPGLPAIGSYGIPMRDEFDLERSLDASPGGA